MRPWGRSVALALLCAFLAPAAAHATCGAEGCPFIRRGLVTGAGRFSFDLRYQDVTQDQLWNGTSETTLDEVILDAEQHGEVELYTRSQTWVAEVRAVVTDRLTVIGSLPYIQREHQHMLRHTPVYNPQFVDTWKYDGVGDATVVGQFAALRGEGGRDLTLHGGIKLPTGVEHVPDEAHDNFGFESTLEPSARPGTGSFDWIMGMSASQPLPWHGALPLTASVLAKVNTPGTDDYRVGHELQAGLAGGWAPLARVTLLGQVNFAAHGSDVSADPSEAAHSAQRALFLTPGLSVGVAHGVSVYGLYQWRAWGDTDEATVVAKDHVLIGTSFSLGH